MSPTIFDASENEEKAKREQLEKQIEELKREAQQKNSTSLPAREESQLNTPVPEPISEPTPDLKPTSEAAPTPEPQPAVQPLPAEEPDSMPENTNQPVVPESPEADESASSVDTDVNFSSATPGLNTPAEEETAVVRKHREPEEYSELLKNNKPTNNPFAAFAIQPVGAHFAGQQTNEHILMVLRQHPIVNVKWMIISLIMILAPLTVAPLIPVFAIVPAQFQFFGFIGWYLLTLAFSIESFLHWYFNIYILTDERIVDIDFYSLIYRSISAAKIENIQDTTAATKGVLGAVFNYGDVTIQTAAEKREFEFLSVPQPATVTKFINELILEEEREKLEGRVS